MHVNGPEGQKLPRKKSLAVGVACKAMFGPTPGLKGRTLSSGFSTDRNLISASAELHCRELGGKRKLKGGGWVAELEKREEEAAEKETFQKAEVDVE